MAHSRPVGAREMVEVVCQTLNHSHLRHMADLQTKMRNYLDNFTQTTHHRGMDEYEYQLPPFLSIGCDRVIHRLVHYQCYGVLEYVAETPGRREVESLGGGKRAFVVMYGLGRVRLVYYLGSKGVTYGLGSQGAMYGLGLGSEGVARKVVVYRCLQGSSSRCTYVE
jgi:hypothetical protein